MEKDPNLPATLVLGLASWVLCPVEQVYHLAHLAYHERELQKQQLLQAIANNCGINWED